eukprot:12423135-Karenia_brevis.AAC.1
MEVLRLRGGADDSDNEEQRTLIDFAVILKNARSLTSDERLTEVISELEGEKWDVVLINETWREEKEEFDALPDGHVWLGSGGTAGRRGVGILVHGTWAGFVHRWSAINERVGVLEINRKNLKL